MPTYVIADIHNSIKKLDKLLTLISPSMQDQIFLLGDLFDRGGADPDPVGVYHRISGLNTNVTWIRGNHDQLNLKTYMKEQIYFVTKSKDCLISELYSLETFRKSDMRQPRSMSST